MSVDGQSLSSGRVAFATPAIPPQSGAAVRHAVVTATLANAQLSAAKTTSELYYEKYKALDEENGQLKADLEQQQTDALVVIRQLEHQLMEAFDAANAFKCSVQDRLAKQAEAEAEVTRHYEDLLKDRDRTITDLSALVTRLQNDLRQASRHVQQRQQHQQELHDLHTTIEEMVLAHEREAAALRFQSVDHKMKLVALERTMQEEFQDMVEQESRRLLEAKHSALLRQNRTLEKDKEGLARGMDELIALTSKINTEKTRMKRVAQLQRTAHEEVLRHTVARNRQGREATERVQKLEARVRELTAEAKEAKATQKAAYEGRIKELETELASAQSAAHTLQSELRMMRGLASKVVEQRTDLEKFFYTALEDCKRYKSGKAAALGHTTAATTTATTTTHSGRAPLPVTARSSGKARLAATGGSTGGGLRGTAASSTFRLTQPTLADTYTHGRGTPAAAAAAAAAAAPVDGGSSLPPVGISSGPSSPPPPSASDGGAHIEDLSWEDKEKVIKALFFYINANYYKPSPTTV